jgi:hypothetical protein
MKSVVENGKERCTSNSCQVIRLLSDTGHAAMPSKNLSQISATFHIRSAVNIGKK